MAPKGQPDLNLMFLYVCFINSEGKNINWDAVATAMDLKIPAARMRFSRLKKVLDAAMVDGKPVLQATAETAGVESDEQGSSPVKKKRPTKRKREDKTEANGEGDDEEIKVEDDTTLVTHESAE